MTGPCQTSVESRDRTDSDPLGDDDEQSGQTPDYRRTNRFIKVGILLLWVFVALCGLLSAFAMVVGVLLLDLFGGTYSLEVVIGGLIAEAGVALVALLAVVARHHPRISGGILGTIGLGIFAVTPFLVVTVMPPVAGILLIVGSFRRGGPQPGTHPQTAAQ